MGAEIVHPKKRKHDELTDAAEVERKLEKKRLKKEAKLAAAANENMPQVRFILPQTTPVSDSK
jgi:hypothetical protein